MQTFFSGIFKRNTLSALSGLAETKKFGELNLYFKFTRYH